MKDFYPMFFSKLRNSAPSKNILNLSLIVSGCIALSACDLAKNQLTMDREKNMELQDYRDAMAPRLPEVDSQPDGSRGADNIPPLQPYVALPDSNVKAMPLVSINVNQNVPLRNALYQLAEQAEFDVEIDPRISGSIIFSARNRPLDQVMERLSELAGLRYKMDDDSIRVELDTPFHKIYPVQYLNITRENESTIENEVSIVSGEGADSGSTFATTSISNSDFWAELEENLEQIILLSDVNVQALTTENGVNISAASSLSSLASAIEPLMLNEGELEGSADVQVQAPGINLEVAEGSEGEDGAAAESANETSTEGPQPYDARFSINRQAGIISVYAPERIHKKVEKYLDEVKRQVSSQVLIEVKVLEVALSDEYSAGIDWSNTRLFNNDITAGFGLSQIVDPLAPVTGATSLVRGVLSPSTNPAINGRISYTGNDTTAFVDALSRFGTVSALSSPRMTVMNNQSSVLSVAENVVYFELTSTVTPATAVGVPPTITYNSEINTVPEGVLINVIPSINLDDNTISMSIRPTVTSIVGQVPDPNPDLATAGVVSNIPQVNVQEFDSILTLNNGQAVVMGGLMQDRVTSQQLGVPVVSEIPILGNLFKNQSDSVEKTELVVLIKATIVEQGNTIHPTDKDMYRTFSRDRRPFKL